MLAGTIFTTVLCAGNTADAVSPRGDTIRIWDHRVSFIPCVFWGFYFCRTWHRNILRSLDQPGFGVVRQEGTQALPWRGSYTNTHVIWTMNKVWQALGVQGSHCLRGMQGSAPEKTSTTHSHSGGAARQSSDATSLVQDICSGIAVCKCSLPQGGPQGLLYPEI